MNISLTWANYALIAGVCLIGYYIVVGLVYYRKDLVRLVRSKKEQTSFTGNQQLFSTVTNNLQPVTVHEDSFTNTESTEAELNNQQPTIEDFMDEIYAYTQACGNNITKEDLEINLRRIIHKYPSLINSSLWNVLAGVIATACENNCSVQWREDELNELRNG